MDLDELARCLGPFCAAKYPTSDVEVFDVHHMPGHAGFAYGFSVRTSNRTESWFIRLPPPNVNWRGTADVLRQVEVLTALDGTDIPHCSVKWSGSDLEWFGSPYFVVPRLDGDVMRIGPGEWVEKLSEKQKRELGRQVMSALVKIHKIMRFRLSRMLSAGTGSTNGLPIRSCWPGSPSAGSGCLRRCQRRRPWEYFMGISKPPTYFVRSKGSSLL